MIRLIILLSVFMFYASAVNAEIISIVNNGSAIATTNQSKVILTDYLELRLFRETIDRSIAHIKTMPEFKDSANDLDDIKFITILVSRLSILNTTYSTDKGKLKVTMRINVELDPSTVNRYLEKSLENNQFKAFGRKFLENLLTLETTLLSAETDNDNKLKKDVNELLGIQRARSYEMNQLSLNAFNESSSNSPAEKAISESKDRLINSLLADMTTYETEQQKEVEEMLKKMNSYTKERLLTLKSIEDKYIALPYQFNTSPDHDLISAKNEMITTRKKIQNLTKSFFVDIDLIQKSIDDGYDGINKFISKIKFYDVDPIKDRWESSYHYAYRLNNYQTRINKTELFISNNNKKIFESKYRANKIVKINSLISLLKILQPYENHLKELQETQYEGIVTPQDTYIVKIGTPDTKKGIIPITVRFQSNEYILNFDISKFDATKVKYLTDYSRYFIAYPLFRLTSSGPDPYDIDPINSGFLIIHRGDKSKQQFLVNTKLKPFPETLYSDEFKQILVRERAELKQRTSESITDISSTSDKPYRNDQYFAILPLTKIADKNIITDDTNTKTIDKKKDADEFENYINDEELDNITKKYQESQNPLLFKSDLKKYKGSLSVMLGSSSPLGFGSNSNVIMRNGLFGITGQYHIGYFAIEPGILYLNSGPGYNDLKNYHASRIDYFVSFLFEYPIYINENITLLPYIGPGVGLSSFTVKSITSDNFIGGDVINSNTLLVSAKLGLKFTYSNLLLGAGVQFNRSVPVILSRARDYSNYSFFFEIGYAFLGK